MFYAIEVLSKKGKLGVIWLAATYGRKHLSSREYRAVNIPRACHAILHPPEAFSLRLSAMLTLGVTRIYNEQTRFVFGEARQIRDLLQHKPTRNIDRPNNQAREDAITLPDPTSLPITQDWPELLRFMQIDESSQSSSASSAEENGGKGSSGSESPKGPGRGLGPPEPQGTPSPRTPPLGPNQASPMSDIMLPHDEVDANGALLDPPPYQNDFERPDRVPPEDPTELIEPRGPEEGEGMSSIWDGDVGPGDREDTDVRLINPETGKLEIVSPESPPHTEGPIRPDEKTPSPLKRPPADLEAPPPPAKKRRKRKPKGPLIDNTTQIPSPRRILEPETERPRLYTPPAPSAAMLFKTPAKEESGMPRFLDMWRRNAFVRIEEFVLPPPSTSFEDEEEIERRRQRESSIGADMSSVLNRLSLDSKIDETGNRSGADDWTIGEHDLPGDFDQLSLRGPGSPVPDLSPVPEEQEPNISSNGIQDINGDSEGNEDDEEKQQRMMKQKIIQTFYRKLHEAMGSQVQVTFHQVVSKATKRLAAAIAFYQTLAMVKSEEIVMEQLEPFGEITIFIGPNWQHPPY